MSHSSLCEIVKLLHNILNANDPVITTGRRAKMSTSFLFSAHYNVFFLLFSILICPAIESGYLDVFDIVYIISV